MSPSDKRIKKKLEDDYELLCKGLTSSPDEKMGIVLVTGASGYIGGRLVYELLGRGYKVRAMVRAASPEYKERWPKAEIVVADALHKDSFVNFRSVYIDTELFCVKRLPEKIACVKHRLGRNTTDVKTCSAEIFLFDNTNLSSA